MPYKDPKKQSEYQKKWLQAKCVDPKKRIRVLALKKKWKEKNREYYLAQQKEYRIKTLAEKKAYRRAYEASEHGKKTRSSYKRKVFYPRHKEKLKAQGVIYKDKQRYGEFWQAHRALVELTKLIKEKANEETRIDG